VLPRKQRGIISSSEKKEEEAGPAKIIKGRWMPGQLDKTPAWI
jgi:hypothetical protein